MSATNRVCQAGRWLSRWNWWSFGVVCADLGERDQDEEDHRGQGVGCDDGNGEWCRVDHGDRDDDFCDESDDPPAGELVVNEAKLGAGVPLLVEVRWISAEVVADVGRPVVQGIHPLDVTAVVL